MTSQEVCERFKVKIKTLTPVHIASGSFLIENRDYYLDKKVIRRIHYPALIAGIPEESLVSVLQQIKTDGVRSLLPKPRKKVEKPKIEEDWKLVLRQKAGITPPPQQVEEKYEPEEMGDLLEEVELYNTPGREDIGSKIQAMAIACTLKTFFPGSSLKGAIRTALYVDSILKQPDLLNRLRFTWTSNPIDADYPLDREMSGVDRNHPGQDIFRHLSVRDSNYLPLSNTLDFFDLRIMNIGGEEGQSNKFVWKKGNKRNVPSYRDADSLYWEMLRPGTEFSTEIIIDQQQKRLATSAMEMEDTVLDITQEKLMRSLNVFARLIAEREIEYAEKYQIPYLRDFYQDLLQKCQEPEAGERVAYLPAGSGLPWHAKTVGKLLETSSLDKIRRHFYRYMGKFMLPNGSSFHGMRLRRGQLGGKQIRPEKLKVVEPFPKTRHFIFIEGRPVCPPGWISLELQ